MKKASQISTENATGEQIGKCRKWTDDSRTSFWLVENESGKLDPETFEIIEYRVDWVVGKGFTCTCGAGKVGFWDFMNQAPSKPINSDAWELVDLIEHEARGQFCSLSPILPNRNSRRLCGSARLTASVIPSIPNRLRID